MSDLNNSQGSDILAGGQHCHRVFLDGDVLFSSITTK